MEHEGGRTLDDDSAGTVVLGDRRVRRIGFCTMRVSGTRGTAGFRPGKIAPGETSLPGDTGREENR